jgi:hypothetical protein
MLTSLFIIAVSLVLLAYWFRYTCLLLLRNADLERKEAAGGFQLAAASADAGEGSLDPLHEALTRDYRVLTYLLDHAAALNLDPLERRMLSADFQVMRFWYRLIRAGAPAQARLALEEMSSVVRVLAYRAGEGAGARIRV